MNIFARSAAVALLVGSGAAAQAGIVGDITGGGSVSGTLADGDGWITNDASGFGPFGVDFWTITAGSGITLLNLTASGSSDTVGLSIYEGTVGDDFAEVLGFDHAGAVEGNALVAKTTDFDFSNPIALSAAVTPGATYTIAIGGNPAGFAAGTLDYDLSVQPVPVPAALPLMAAAAAGLGAFRRRA